MDQLNKKNWREISNPYIRASLYQAHDIDEGMIRSMDGRFYRPFRKGHATISLVLKRRIHDCDQGDDDDDDDSNGGNDNGDVSKGDVQKKSSPFPQKHKRVKIVNNYTNTHTHTNHQLALAIV